MFNKGKAITASELGKLGAAATNKLLTPAIRSKAAKKGWKTRKEREAHTLKANGAVYKIVP